MGMSQIINVCNVPPVFIIVVGKANSNQYKHVTLQMDDDILETIVYL